jgi:hypothetical protein
MKTLKIFTSNQMKSGDLAISTTIQEANMLREASEFVAFYCMYKQFESET